MIVRPSRRDMLRLGPWRRPRQTCRLRPSPRRLAEQADQIVCGYPAGGLTDIFARAYGEYISQKTGQPVSVENKAGAGGAIAAEQVKRAAPDGYTLMWTISTTMIMNKVLFKKLPYDPDKDFVLISWMDAGHLPTIVNKNVPAQEPQGVRRVCAQQQGQRRHLRRGLLQPRRRRGAEPPLRAEHGGRALSRRGADVDRCGSGADPGRQRQLRRGLQRAADRQRPRDRRADQGRA